jgi:2-oxoglutarate dehydrogenase E2 component (dihydrolipoamide succinyltransferase)
MSTLYLKVPALGESIAEAMIGKWKRAEGDAVKADEPLVEVESDKATVEVPAPGGGVLRRILRQAGETVPVGEVIAEIEEGASADAGPQPASGNGNGNASGRGGKAPTPPKGPAAGKVAATATTKAPPQPPPENAQVGAPHPQPRPPAEARPADSARGLDSDGHPPKASPAVRRLMAEQDLSTEDVQPSGPGGRIERGDVDRALQARESQAAAASEALSEAVRERPEPAQARREPPARPPGERERAVPMTPLRKTVARRLLEAQNNAAILTTFNEVNMAEVMGLRERYGETFLKKHGIKLGFMSFFVKAAVDALKAFPLVNAEVRGTDIIYKDHWDIGVAVGGGKGLVVPVVRDADRLSMAEIEKTIADLAVRARENRIQLPELEGGTFTISNGGIYGSMLSTPILNPPQSGILGLHNIQKRPVAVGDQIALRPMMFLALSYDHRIVDGREAVQFLVRIKECIEDPQRLLIEV